MIFRYDVYRIRDWQGVPVKHTYPPEEIAHLQKELIESTIEAGQACELAGRLPIKEAYIYREVWR